MRKLFFVLLVLFLAGVAGLSAAPPRSGGGDDTTQMVMPFEAVELICLWADQYQAGLLTQDEFKVLVAGRITVMCMGYVHEQPSGMYALAKETRKKMDLLFLYRELELGIQHPRGLSE
jgi:hypothetical protein